MLIYVILYRFFPIFGCAKGVLTIPVARLECNGLAGLGGPEISVVWWCGLVVSKDSFSFEGFLQKLVWLVVWLVVWFGGVVWWCGL